MPKRSTPDLVYESICISDFAFNGQLEQLERFVNEDNVNLVFQSLPLLAHAAMAPQDRGVECMKFLLKLGADPLKTFRLGETPMHFAAVHDNPECIRVLHSNNSKLIHIPSSYGDTPLLLAAALNNFKAVRQLLSLGADPKAANSCRKITPIEMAVNYQSWSSFFLMTEAVHVNSMDESTKQLLLDREKKAEQLCVICQYGNFDMLKQVATKENVNLRWKSRTPLLWIAGNGFVEDIKCAKLLMELGANVFMSDTEGFTVAHYAAMSGHEDLVKVLPRSCLTQPNFRNVTPLELAIHSRMFNVVDTLSALGVVE